MICLDPPAILVAQNSRGTFHFHSFRGSFFLGNHQKPKGETAGFSEERWLKERKRNQPLGKHPEILASLSTQLSLGARGVSAKAGSQPVNCHHKDQHLRPRISLSHAKLSLCGSAQASRNQNLLLEWSTQLSKHPNPH